MVSRLKMDFKMVITRDVKKLYKDILNKTFYGEQKGRGLRTGQIKTELGKLSVRLESIEIKFLDDLINAPTYYSIKERTGIRITQLNEELKCIDRVKKDIEEYLRLGISFLHGVDVFYKNSPANIKKQKNRSVRPVSN